MEIQTKMMFFALSFNLPAKDDNNSETITKLKIMSDRDFSAVIPELWKALPPHKFAPTLETLNLILKHIFIPWFLICYESFVVTSLFVLLF